MATGIPAPVITYYINGSIIPSTYTFSKGTTKVTALASNGVTPDASCSFTVTVVCNPNTEAARAMPAKEANTIKGLTVTAHPNPSNHFFTLLAVSQSEQPAQHPGV
jgi:hypothetical protein